MKCNNAMRNRTL